MDKEVNEEIKEEKVEKAEGKSKKINLWRKLKKNIKLIIALIIILCIALFMIFGVNRKADVDTALLTQLLTKSSELTTAKLKLTGLSEYNDEGVYILNRSDFTMYFTATVRAGINLENVKIESDSIQKKIFITIPAAEIFEVKVDPENIRFYDTGFALFNVDEKEDLAKALSLAEKDAREQAAGTGILELANQQSEILIKGILANAIPDGYTIEVKK